MKTFGSVRELMAAKGETFGPSDWVTVDQTRIGRFAEATDDFQWIHVDPERAASGPFGGTVAHGFLTLSLFPVLLNSLYKVENVKMGINYGLNKVRFPAPVPVGARLRLTATFTDVREGDGFVENLISSVMELDGSDRPACVIESIGRLYA